ncbi:hypothetical protein [Microbacterium sp. B24]|uniref:hypothetical protein n=1 Tax=Microbacterium sp. B24 TaxID=95616 RepID=UPI00055A014D|nr:hypothetical protein [Microbacterium sp. B24]
MDEDITEPGLHLRRAGVSAGLILVCAAAVWGSPQIRAIEASAASAMISASFAAVSAVLPALALRFGLSGSLPFTVTIAESSSVVFLIVPFVLAGAVLVLSTRFSILRVLKALAVAIAILVETSMLETVFLNSGMRWWGWSEQPLLQGLLPTAFLSIGIAAASAASWLIAVDPASRRAEL